MSAAEIIEQIMQLPPEEQGKVVDFVEHLKQEPKVECADNESFEKAADAVFAKHDGLLRRLAQ